MVILKGFKDSIGLILRNIEPVCRTGDNKRADHIHRQVKGRLVQ